MSRPAASRKRVGHAIAAFPFQDPRLNHVFNYGYRGVGPKIGGTTKDIAWFISPPGRFTEGRNDNGVEDIAGNLLHYYGIGFRCAHD